MTTRKQLWSNEKVAAQLFQLRIKAAAQGNAAYVALLSTVIDRVEKEIG